MELHNFEEMMAMTSSLGTKCTMAVAGAGTPSAIDAVLDSYDNGIADAVLVGEPDKIRALLEERGRRPADFSIVKTADGQTPAETAVDIIKQGEANFLLRARWKPPTCSALWGRRRTACAPGALSPTWPFTSCPSITSR